MTTRLRVAHLMLWVVSAVGLVAPLLLPALSAATARAAPYAASYDSECCYGETIESGAIEPEYFVLTNVGSATWGEAGGPSINLGTDVPQNRYSEFEAPDWPAPGRPVKGVNTYVPPGSSYKFIFDVKAPVVSKPTELVEHFGLLAELDVWMDASSGLGPDLYLPFMVMPAQPPTIAITSIPASIKQGEQVSVTAQATDNVSVNHVVLWLAGQQVSSGPPRNPNIAADEQTSWTASATFESNRLSTGLQTVVATAYDDAGASAITTGTIDIQPVLPVSPQPPPAAVPQPPRVVNPFRMYYGGLTVPGQRDRLRLTHIGILGTVKGEHVTITCSHCAGQRRFGPVVAKGSEVEFHPRRLIVSGRSKLTVDVASPGRDGRFRVYAILVKSISESPREQGCLVPNTTKHVKCPR